MYERILLPTDGDPSAAGATRHAVDLAAATGATLDVLYVVDEDVYGAYPGDEYVHEDEGAESALEAAGEEALEDVATMAADAGVETRTTLRYGHPHEAIIDHAETEDVDLVVMGTKARSGEYRQLLGSVTDRVVRLASRPVLVIEGEDA